MGEDPGLTTQDSKAASAASPTNLTRMNSLLIAASSAAPPGDDLQTVAYVLLGIAMTVTAIATVIITPRAHHEDH